MINNCLTWSDRCYEIFEVEPENLPGYLKRLKIGHEAKEWMKQEMDRFKEFLNDMSTPGELVPVMQDGGLPAPGVLQEFDKETWKKFEEEFLHQE